MSNQDQFLTDFVCTIPKKAKIRNILLLTLKTPLFGRSTVIFDKNWQLKILIFMIKNCDIFSWAAAALYHSWPYAVIL
jgi:hypothetical protein